MSKAHRYVMPLSSIRRENIRKKKYQAQPPVVQPKSKDKTHG